MGKWFTLFILWIVLTVALRLWVGPTFLDAIDIVGFKTILLFCLIAIGGFFVGITEALAPIFTLVGTILTILFSLSYLSWVGCGIVVFIILAMIVKCLGILDD